jgi:hypothetical protein
MPKQICEISTFIWFYYEKICYDARSYERIKKLRTFTSLSRGLGHNCKKSCQSYPEHTTHTKTKTISYKLQIRC